MFTSLIPPVINQLHSSNILTKTFVTVYVDDVVIAANDEKDLYSIIMIVLKQLRVLNLTVKPEKIQIGKTVKLLGNEIFETGHQINDLHFKTIQNLHISENITKKQFVYIYCLLLYFRTFSLNFAANTVNIKVAKSGKPFSLPDAVEELRKFQE